MEISSPRLNGSTALLRTEVQSEAPATRRSLCQITAESQRKTGLWRQQYREFESRSLRQVSEQRTSRTELGVVVVKNARNTARFGAAQQTLSDYRDGASRCQRTIYPVVSVGPWSGSLCAGYLRTRISTRGQDFEQQTSETELRLAATQTGRKRDRDA